MKQSQDRNLSIRNRIRSFSSSCDSIAVSFIVIEPAGKIVFTVSKTCLQDLKKFTKSKRDLKLYEIRG